MSKVLLQLTKEGRIVPDPLTGKPVGPDGLSVTTEADGRLPRYWRRRIAAGDVSPVADQLALKASEE